MYDENARQTIQCQKNNIQEEPHRKLFWKENKSESVYFKKDIKMWICKNQTKKKYKNTTAFGFDMYKCIYKCIRKTTWKWKTKKKKIREENETKREKKRKNERNGDNNEDLSEEVENILNEIECLQSFHILQFSDHGNTRLFFFYSTTKAKQTKK